VKKKKIVRNELSIVILLVVFIIGAGIFYFQHQAKKMSENGVAIHLNIESKKEWGQPFEIYLIEDNGQKTLVDIGTTIKNSETRKLILFDDTADLIWISDGHEYKLVLGIDGKKRQELTATIRVSEQENKLNFDVSYRFNNLVDFSKYQ
jgi:predicted cupin superfamily sugar epimerase